MSSRFVISCSSRPADARTSSSTSRHASGSNVSRPSMSVTDAVMAATGLFSSCEAAASNDCRMSSVALVQLGLAELLLQAAPPAPPAPPRRRTCARRGSPPSVSGGRSPTKTSRPARPRRRATGTPSPPRPRRLLVADERQDEPEALGGATERGVEALRALGHQHVAEIEQQPDLGLAILGRASRARARRPPATRSTATSR